MTDENMKKRGLKNRKPLSNAIRIDLYDGLEELHQRTRIPKSKLLDEAVEDLLKKHKERGNDK